MERSGRGKRYELRQIMWNSLKPSTVSEYRTNIKTYGMFCSTQATMLTASPSPRLKPDSCRRWRCASTLIGPAGIGESQNFNLSLVLNLPYLDGNLELQLHTCRQQLNSSRINYGISIALNPTAKEWRISYPGPLILPNCHYLDHIT